MFIRIVLPVLALAITAPAAAQPVTIAVPYGDLDLTKIAGRDVLAHRLTRATRQVCGSRPFRDLAQIVRYKACLADAQARTQPQVELALNNANARRVAVLADKIGLLASF